MKIIKKVISVIVSAVILLTGAVWLTGCEEKAPGSFYTLQEGYDNGWLTQEDLLSIAYYGNGSGYNEELIGENFVPLAKTPEQLDEETEEKIKETYVDFFTKENPDMFTDNSPMTTSNVSIIYCGTYDGHIVAQIKAQFMSIAVVDGFEIYEECIAEVKFRSYVKHSVRHKHWFIWEENNSNNMFFWW